MDETAHWGAPVRFAEFAMRFRRKTYFVTTAELVLANCVTEPCAASVPQKYPKKKRNYLLVVLAVRGSATNVS